MTGPEILAAVAGGLVYVAWLYFHPDRPCTRCGGSGQNRFSTRSQWGQCKKCGGTRKQFHLGSKAVHKAVAAVRGRQK